MRSAWNERPAYDRNNPNRTAPTVVNYDLDHLKVGENRVVVGRKDGYDLHDRDIAPGDGWSRALYAPECAWPRGADLCVVVEWHPDRKVGSDWSVRLEAVTDGLRSLDYVVEWAVGPSTRRRICTPTCSSTAWRPVRLRLAALATRGRTCLPRAPTRGTRSILCTTWRAG